MSSMRRRRNSIGRMMSLVIILDRARESTTIMAVARGEAAQEHQHRDELAVEGQRQAQDEAVGLRARLRKDEEAREGDRQHEDV